MQLAWWISTILLLALTVPTCGRIGKVCKHVGDSVWTCRPKRNCTTAAIEWSSKRPCNTTGPEPLVCCQPEGDDLPVGAISQQKCEEYAKSVFEKEYDSFLEEYLDRDTCLSLEPLLVHDSPAEPLEYLHTAYLGFGTRYNITWICGASLISKKFVLSAAHCVGRGATKSRWARIGDYNAYSLEDEENSLALSQTIKVIRHYKHKKYKESSLLYNIALFELKVEVELSEYIRPICLFTEDKITIDFGIATGWGWGGTEWEKSNILQKSNMSITLQNACKNHHLHQDKLEVNRTLDNDDSIFCATDSFQLSRNCKGDSGGPLQIRLSNPYCMYGLLGISSYCTTHEGAIPTVYYTRVSKYTRWIESIVWPFHQNHSP